MLVSIAARQITAAEALQSRQDELDTRTKTETRVPEETNTQKEGRDEKGDNKPAVLKTETEEEAATPVASADEQVVGSPLAWRTMASMPLDEWKRERQVRRERVLRRETEQHDRRK